MLRPFGLISRDLKEIRSAVNKDGIALVHHDPLGFRSE